MPPPHDLCVLAVSARGALRASLVYPPRKQTVLFWRNVLPESTIYINK
jgi:hypothetical protein